MSGLSRSSLLAVVLAGAAALSACTPTVNTTGTATPATPPAQPETPAVVQDQPATLAILAPTSASNANAAGLGRALVNAARMAATDLGDPLVKVQVYDTAGDATQAKLAAEKAIGEGAVVIIGPLFSGSTKAVAGPAAAAGVKVLSFSTDASAAGDPVYLTGFLPEVAAARVTTFARARGYDAIGVLYPDNLYGAAALRGAQGAVPGNIVASAQYARTREGIPAGTSSFAGEALAAGASAVLLADSGQALNYVGALVQSFGLSPTEVKYLGLGEWNSRATLAENSLKGGWFAAPDPAAMRAFVEKYEARYGGVPPVQAVLAYDAVKIAAELLTEARTTGGDPFAIPSLTRGRGFQGAVGPIQFGQDGLGRRGMAILEVGEGVFETVDPATTIVGAGS